MLPENQIFSSGNAALHPELPQRKGRGKSQKSLTLVSSAAEILKEIRPATVRAVCYRLFVSGLIPNMSKGATDKVSKQLVWARETGLIPWHWIVDETRHAERVAVWDDIADQIDSAVACYRRDNWQEQPNTVEVWSEKGTVRGTFWPILSAYGVTFRVLHGFGSATALNDIARRSLYSKKPIVALYVGDFDCSGLFMSEVDIPTRLERYQGEIDLRRIALTEDDTKGELPYFDAATKSGDSRYRWFTQRYGGRCWELDALSPVTLRERVESAIWGLLDIDAWNHSRKIERVEVESMKGYAAQWKESISRQASKYDGGAK